MIDIPTGKALMPVEADVDSDCSGCIFNDDNDFCTKLFVCFDMGRKDGKNVIFKLTDWPVKEREK